jgi:hypothetical protein
VPTRLSTTYRYSLSEHKLSGYANSTLYSTTTLQATVDAVRRINDATTNQPTQPAYAYAICAVLSDDQRTGPQTGLVSTRLD